MIAKEDQQHLHSPNRARQVHKHLGTGTLAVLLLAVLAARPHAAVIEIFPSTVTDCNEEFENVANTLQPGDELILHGGTYSQTCRRAVTVNGTQNNPIIIRAADGETPLITRPSGQYTQNNIEIINSSYLAIRGLHFQGGDRGVRFNGGHHVTFEDNKVFETGNNAVTLNDTNTDSFTIRHNEIRDTGQRTDILVVGEGLYVGCNNATCVATNHLIKNNYIHHLRATSNGGNDGIEVKVGSYGNIIRDNVIHDTNIGTQQYPCIFVYGGGPDVNVVEGNAVWNCGQAIQVVSDAIVRNNLIITSSIEGIRAGPHAQVAVVRNVTIINNTVYGHPTCLFVRWSGATNMVLANNALYCPGGTAVNALSSGLAGATVSSNYVEGSLSGASIDNVGFFDGGSASSAFIDAAGFNLWPAPGSVLLNNASAAFVPATDFNGTTRTSPYDVGAYETEGLSANPGWQVGPGFKQGSTAGNGGDDGGGTPIPEPATAVLLGAALAIFALRNLLSEKYASPSLSVCVHVR